MAGEMYEDAVYAKETDSDAKTWGMICHLASFAGYLIPFGNIIGPFIVWQLKKDTSEFVNYNGKESVNFQITVTIALIAAIPLILLVIGIFMLIAIPIIEVGLAIIAAVKASNGDRYRYPLTLRLIK
jgi:uncharacterized Tic20 family protein